MIKEQLGQPLMNTAVLEVQTTGQVEQSAFIKRYNLVITCYNRASEDDQPKMQVIVGNSFIYKIGEALSRPINNIFIVMILLFIPVVNLMCLACLFMYLFYLKRQNKKHKRNVERVKDPFRQFFYLPEMCEHLGKHHATLNLQQNQLQGFTFNQELRQKLSNKLKAKQSKKDNQQLTVMIYDQYFYDSFYLYRKEYFKTLIWSICGVFCITLSILLYAAIFQVI